MIVTVERIGTDGAVVEVEGEVDAHTAGDLDGRLFEVLTSDRSKLAIGLGGVTYVSSAGLGALWRAHQEATRRGGGVRLYSVPERVARVLAMAGLDQVILSTATRDEAIRELVMRSEDPS
jgi:anti-sigma B factor antagonist